MICRALICLLCFSAYAPAIAAPPHGVIETRTDLPRTLPLQIKTGPDRDAYIVLRDAETDAIVLTAYAKAGKPFRALVPPGTFTLHVALGTDWHSPQALFGDSTQLYDLPRALSFSAGYARKSGHLVDLTAIKTNTRPVLRDYAICQFYTPGPDRATPPRMAEDTSRETSVAPQIPAGAVRPPGPFDPLLDGAPELGLPFGNTVQDVPLARRATQPGVPTLDLPGGAVAPDRLRARICD